MTIDLSNVNTNAPAYTRASKLRATRLVAEKGGWENLGAPGLD